MTTEVVDLLLDLRAEMAAERDRLNKADDARVGVNRCIHMLDDKLSLLVGSGT
jgi:hypothetical protein